MAVFSQGAIESPSMAALREGRDALGYDRWVGCELEAWVLGGEPKVETMGSYPLIGGLSAGMAGWIA
jgi:hypothetical protein